MDNVPNAQVPQMEMCPGSNVQYMPDPITGRASCGGCGKPWQTWRSKRPPVLDPAYRVLYHGRTVDPALRGQEPTT
jgi:hypothetical protein